MQDKKRDKQILDLKKQIEIKEEALKATLKFKPLTNLILPLNGSKLNLNVLSKDELLFAIANLVNVKNALSSVGVTDLPDLGGYSIEDWIHDLKGKYDLVNKKAEQDKLAKMQKVLDELLSESVKKDNKLQEILKELA